MGKVIFAICMIFMALTGKVYADDVVLTFDDIGPLTDPYYAPIGNYGGFSWGQYSYYFHRNLGSAFANGVQSGDYAAFAPSGEDIYLTSNTPFNFVGAYFTSLDYVQPQLSIEGYLNGGNYQKITKFISQTRTWYDFNINNVDELYIYHDSGGNNRFTMDNMTVTPEPVSMVLFLVGGMPIAAHLLRKRKFNIG